MTDAQSVKCHGIIHTATAAAAAIGGGLAQIPYSDAVPIMGAQITMIISLGAVFGIPVSKMAAKAIVEGFAAAASGRLATQWLGWIPIAGNILNASTAAAITEGIGWQAAKQFDKEAQQKVKPSSL